MLFSQIIINVGVCVHASKFTITSGMYKKLLVPLNQKEDAGVSHN